MARKSENSCHKLAIASEMTVIVVISVAAAAAATAAAAAHKQQGARNYFASFLGAGAGPASSTQELDFKAACEATPHESTICRQNVRMLHAKAPPFPSTIHGCSARELHFTAASEIMQISGANEYDENS